MVKIKRKALIEIGIILLVYSGTGYSQNPTQVSWPVTPNPVAVSYGDRTPPKEGLHPGVDIPGKAKKTKVVCIKEGCCRFRGPSGYKASVVISDNLYSYHAWVYGHLEDIPLWIQPGKWVNKGDSIGVIAEYGDFDHLHFAWTLADWEEWPMVNSTHYPPGYANPLRYLIPEALQEPQIIEDRIYFVPDKTEGPFLRPPIYGNADIAVKASCTINGDERAGVYGIGFEVDGPVEGSDIPFTTLMEFRGVLPFGNVSEFKRIYWDNNQGEGWKLFHNYYIVTNFKKEGGSPTEENGLANVDENAWKTKINKTGDKDAFIHSQARFPDGKYNYTIKAWTASEVSTEYTGEVEIDNFKPYVDRLRIEQVEKVIKYEKHWELDGDRLKLVEDVDDYCKPNEPITFYLYLSEKMQTEVHPKILVAFNDENNTTKLVPPETGLWMTDDMYAVITDANFIPEGATDGKVGIEEKSKPGWNSFP